MVVPLLQALGVSCVEIDSAAVRSYKASNSPHTAYLVQYTTLLDGATVSVAQRLKDKLREQLSFIETSTVAYDQGRRHEALRIGTALRVLFHQTAQSASLLSQLNAEHVQLLSTAGADEPNAGTILFEGLARITSGPDHFIPKLGDGIKYANLPVEQWWNQAVLVADCVRYSRKALALMAANKEGGAHVDPSLPSEHQKLVDGFWQVSLRKDRTDMSLIPNHHYVYLRQLGFEVLTSSQLLGLL